MTNWSALLLIVCAFILLAAGWYARVAKRHAETALQAAAEAKSALAAWWRTAEPGR